VTAGTIIATIQSVTAQDASTPVGAFLHVSATSIDLVFCTYIRKRGHRTVDAQERARAAVQARWAKTTPEQRQETGRRTYLAGAVKTVARRINDLTPEQLTMLTEAMVKAATR
jgi:hypothetical protein